jgi:hypothetical protein
VLLKGAENINAVDTAKEKIMSDVDKQLLENLFIRHTIIDINEQPYEILIWGNINDLSTEGKFSINTVESKNYESAYFSIKTLYEIYESLCSFVITYENYETDVNKSKDVKAYFENPNQSEMYRYGTNAYMTINVFNKNKYPSNIHNQIRVRIGICEAKYLKEFLSCVKAKHEENANNRDDADNN